MKLNKLDLKEIRRLQQLVLKAEEQINMLSFVNKEVKRVLR